MDTTNLTLAVCQTKQKNGLDSASFEPMRKLHSLRNIKKAEAMIVGYEFEPDSVSGASESDVLTWICQLTDGQRIHAYLSSDLVVNAFEAMNYIGCKVKLTIGTLTNTGKPDLATIANFSTNQMQIQRL